MNELIRQPDILKKIGKLASAGLSYIGIAATLKAEDGIDVTPPTIKRIYDEFSRRSVDIIAGDKQFKEMIKADVLGIIDQMKAINTEAWDIIHELQQAKDKQPGTILKALKEIRGQLELNLRLSERLTSSVETAKVNKVELTQNIVNIFEKLKTEGYGEVERCPKCGWSKEIDPVNLIKNKINQEQMEELKMAEENLESNTTIKVEEEEKPTGPGGHVPDGTGPHGAGMGPGEGEADGSGLESEDEEEEEEEEEEESEEEETEYEEE